MRWTLALSLAAALSACQEVLETADATVMMPADVAVTPDGGGPSDFDIAHSDAWSPRADAIAPRDTVSDDGAPPPVDANPSPPDTGPPDAAVPPSPIDIECPTPWTALGENVIPTCAGRRVVIVGRGITPYSVAIARSGQGRVALGWNTQEFADRGSFVLKVLDEADLTEQFSEQIDPVAVFGESVGIASAIAVLRETFHLVTWLQSDVGGEIQYRQLRADDVLTPPEVVSPLVGRNGTVDVVAGENGDVHVAWHDKGSGVFGVRDRDAVDAAWAEAFTLDTDLTDRVPGFGAIAAVLGDGRILHVAYQLAQTLNGAVPMTRSRVGGQWTGRRTLDNNANDRLSGISVDIAIVGERRAAAYLDWVGGTGELRLARWLSADSPVEISVLLGGLPLAERPPRFPLALAADASGLLHLVVLNPGGAGTSTLEYRRQAYVGGQVRWLVDIIDHDVSQNPDDGMHIDLFVDERRRPHIIYSNPNDGSVRYATVTAGL